MPWCVWCPSALLLCGQTCTAGVVCRSTYKLTAQLVQDPSCVVPQQIGVVVCAGASQGQGGGCQPAGRYRPLLCRILLSNCVALASLSVSVCMARLPVLAFVVGERLECGEKIGSRHITPFEALIAIYIPCWPTWCLQPFAHRWSSSYHCDSIVQLLISVGFVGLPRDLVSRLLLLPPTLRSSLLDDAQHSDAVLTAVVPDILHTPYCTRLALVCTDKGLNAGFGGTFHALGQPMHCLGCWHTGLLSHGMRAPKCNMLH